MSKAQLKKLMRGMSAEDLADLVIQLYDARKEAKEYLEYYINPDINTKYEKACDAIDKELIRSRRRQFAVRISQIKAIIKNFITYAPDDQMICELYMRSFLGILTRARSNYTSFPFRNALSSFLLTMMDTISNTGLMSDYYKKICESVNDFPDRYYDNRYTKQLLNEALETFHRTHPFY